MIPTEILVLLCILMTVLAWHEAILNMEMAEEDLHFRAGEKAVVLSVIPDREIVEIQFTASGRIDHVNEWILDLVSRPDSDPSLYEKTLFD